MRCLYRFLIILFLSCTVIGCAPPVGNITGTSGGGTTDSLEALPKRTVYKIHNPFLWAEDLAVASIQRGLYYYIPVSQVKITILEIIDKEEVVRPVDKEEPAFMFATSGTKTVVIEYGKLSATYKVEVDDPLGIGEGSGSGDSGIIVGWRCKVCGLYPCKCCKACGAFPCKCADCGCDPCTCADCECEDCLCEDCEDTCEICGKYPCECPSP